jgi:hypothetical protein
VINCLCASLSSLDPVPVVREVSDWEVESTILVSPFDFYEFHKNLGIKQFFEINNEIKRLESSQKKAVSPTLIALPFEKKT